MVLVEVRVLCGDYSVLVIWRDLAERNEFVVFAPIPAADLCQELDIQGFAASQQPGPCGEMRGL
jgi:hypothetical protein